MERKETDPGIGFLINNEKEIKNKIIKAVEDAVYENHELSTASWRNVSSLMNMLGYGERDAVSYLSSVSQLHGGDILVRRANLSPVLSAVESDSVIKVVQHDTEPNAALLGGVVKNKNGTEVSGVEVAFSGGFDWVVKDKVAGLYGFLKNDSQLKISTLSQDSLSRTKQYNNIMVGIHGEIASDDVLFFMFRIHKSAYPDELCTDDDFDPITGERKPFVIRLYAKNRQTH